MRNKPPTKFKIGEKEIDLGQDRPAAEQEAWKKNLVLVSALPERMIGIVEDGAFEAIDAGKPFKLYATLIYIAELAFSPVVQMEEQKDGSKRPVMRNGQPVVVGVQGSTKLHALIPYDFIGTPTIDVVRYQYAIRVNDQDELFQRWVHNEFQNFYDPPKVELIR